MAKISETMRAKTSKFRNIAILLLKTIFEIKTTALNFGFSYWDYELNEDIQLNEQNKTILLEYLADTYSATYIIKSDFFLIIQCEVMPTPKKILFLVANCIVIWLH